MSLCLHEWYFMATWLPTSDDLFCAHTLSCWPILYMNKFLMAYSVHIPPMLTYFFYVPPIHDLNPISTTSSWISLYTSNFYCLICSLSSPWWANLYLRDILWPCARISADRFCRLTLYTYPPILTDFMYVPPIHDFGQKIRLYTILYIYFSLVGLYLHFLATCTSFWWYILYTYLHLVIYSVRREDFEGLFCTHSSPCLICSLRVPLRHDLVCRLLIFMANFV